MRCKPRKIASRINEDAAPSEEQFDVLERENRRWPREESREQASEGRKMDKSAPVQERYENGESLREEVSAPQDRKGK